jgi:membrane fusion protein (multidrug efflux system)
LYNAYRYIALICFVLACKSNAKPGAASGEKPKGPPPEFEAVVAAAFPLNRSIEAPGTILPNENTDLHPEISGRIVAINLKEGAVVKAGTTLIKLFDDDLQAQLKKLVVQLRIAEATEQRQKELLAVNGTSQQDFDNASLTVSNIKADIELLKVDIGRTELKAPFNGRLGLRNVSLGAYVTPATIITNIAQVNQIKVEFTVPEKYASEMLPGRTVQLRADGTKNLYYATVIAAQNSIAVDTRSLMVRAQVKNPDAAISPGAFVQVSLAVGNNLPAIMVPTQAVIPSTRFKRVILCRDGKAVFQNVTTGFRDSSRVEILEGIRSGDTIVTNGLLTIKEAMPLKVKVKS